jgi:hypothetical protein
MEHSPSAPHSGQLSHWWSSVHAATHPLDVATQGKVSIADFHHVTLSTESDVVTNVLYMLQGLECDMFLRDLGEEEVNVSTIDAVSEDALTSTKYRRLWTWKLRHGIELPSLISRTLIELMNHFMDLAAVISRLKLTIEIGKTGFGATTFIFVQAVSQFVQAYQDRIYKLQQAHENRPLSLIQLHAHIAPLKAQCKFLGDFVTRSLAPLPNLDYSALVDDLYPDRPRKGKAERTATIFKVLEDAMSEVEDERHLRLVLWIFFCVLGPYLEKVDRWMLYSYLSPSDHDEFCILHTAQDPITSPIFWHSAYTSIKDEVPNFLLASIHRILASGKASLLIQHIQQTVLKFSSQQKASLAPLPTLHEPLFLTSKRLFSQHFDSSWNILHSSAIDAPLPSLLLQLDLNMGNSDSNDSDSALSIELQSFEPSDTQSTNTTDDMLSAFNMDPETTMGQKTTFFASSLKDDESWPSSIQTLLATPVTHNKPTKNKEIDESRLSNVTQLGIPMSSIFHECIASPILQRYSSINNRLLGLLFEDCGLLAHLEAAQQLFFLEPPLSDFYSLSLLPTLWNYSAVGEVTANHWLKQVLDANYDHKLFDQLQRASIHVIGKKSISNSANELFSIDETQLKSMKRIEDVQKLWLDYEAGWPESMFINPTTHELYNSISKSLLHVLAAQYALEQLTTINKTSAGSSSALHKMQLFRNELLLFVRSIREYMVSRVQQVPWSEQEANFRKCDDLDAMLHLHRSHLNQIRERCLLTDNFASLRKAIDRILAIAIDFSRQFQVLHTSVNPSSISLAASASIHISQENQVFLAGMGVDSSTVDRLSVLVEKSHQEFLKLHKFLLTVMAKMSGSSIYLADLQLRLNYSGYYEF